MSCAEARAALGLTFTGGLSTGTATYTGECRPLTKDGLLLVKRGMAFNAELEFDKALNLSIALGV